MTWFETLKGSCGTEKSDEMARVTTTASTGQDEEAAKRTEDKEAKLLAMIRERNKAAREKANEPVEKLVEWVHG
jgi:hypothetical protein|tara:strand:+ start:912 stop:1133 length:222 start_codon:yes stop_codon:yes gene_type:complete